METEHSSQVEIKAGGVSAVVAGAGADGRDPAAWLPAVHRLAERAGVAFFVSEVTAATEGRTRYVSPSIESLIGVSAERIYRDSNACLSVIHPDDLDRVNERTRAAYDGSEMSSIDLEGPCETSKYRVVLPDGRIRWIRTQWERQTDPDGTALIVGLLDDVTDLVETSSRLREITEILATEQGEAYFSGLSSRVAHALGCRFSYLSSFRTENPDYARILSFWPDASVCGSEYPLCNTPCAEIMTGRSLYVPSGARESYPRDEDFQRLGIESFLGVPIYGTGGEPIGVLGAMDTEPISADEDDFRLLEILARRTGSEMERLRAEERLEAAELRNRRMVESTASLTGERFFQTLVCGLSETLGFDRAFIAESVDGDDGMRATYRAFWPDQEFEGRAIRVTDGNPENEAGGDTFWIESGLRGQFPEDEDLARMHAESYVGSEIRGSDGKKIGYIGMIHSEAMPRDEETLGLLRVFAARAGAELERKRATRELVERERRHRVLLDSLYFYVVQLDLEGNFKSINRTLLEDAGVTEEEVLGSNIFEMAWVRENPGLAQQFRDAFEIVASGQRATVGFPAEIAGVGTRATEAVFSPWRDEHGAVVGVLGVGKDISELVSSTREREAIEARFMGLFEGAPNPIMLYDRDVRVIMINEAGSSQLGLRPGEMQGRLMSEFMPGFAEMKRERIRTALETNSSTSYEDEFELVGETRWFRSVYIPLRLPDLDEGAVQVLAYDITERVRAQEAQRTSEESLRQTQKLDAVGRLAGGIAHDFNNLLMTIQGHVDLAKHTLPESHGSMDSLRRVEEATRQATGLTRGLMTFTHRGEGERSPVRLDTLIQRWAGLFRRVLPEQVRLRIDTPEMIWTMGDETQLQQALLNITMNAKDSMPEGGEIVISLTRDGGSGVIEISDTGQGMDRETLDRAEEPFYTTKARGQGTGLGLAITGAVVRAQGGTLEIASEPGVGTRVLIRMPETSPGITPSEQTHGVFAVSAREAGSALLIEDQDLVRGVLRSMLTRLGFTVHAVAGLEEARAALRPGGVFGESRPGLIVADRRLPDGNGMDIIQELENDTTPVPIIMISGDSPTDQGVYPQRCVSLTKPFRLGDLSEAIDRVTRFRPDSMDV